jgi:hypothetical protein
MKDVIINLLENDNSYNKSATRYLYKLYPDLWDQIINATNFLPTNAKPKQRIWHILNDILYRPVCPITGEFVKWHENRYLETISLSAARILQYKSGRTAFGTPELEKKRIDSVRKCIREGKRKPPTLTKDIIQRRIEKTKQTCIERYGVANGSQSTESRNKIHQAAVNRGATPKHLRSFRRLYKERVKYFTELSWRNHFNKINPERLNRSLIDLDHIYSIQQGFEDNIPPYIIGHWTNLQMLEKKENYSKGRRCDKSRDQLFEDFFQSIGKY